MGHSGFPNFSLLGKVAVVTGSTKGLGLGISHGLAEAGADIVVVSRNYEDCAKVATEIEKKGQSALPVKADVRSLVSIDELIKKVVDRYGRIDILVNNAGTAITKPPEVLTEDEWDDVINVNLKGAFFMAQKAGLQMIKQRHGKIINVGSIFSFVGDANIVAYCTSKGGLLLMTKSLALAWARYNIQVNLIAPGYIETEINKKVLNEDKVFNHIMFQTPARRLGTVRDIVGAIVYLASDATNYMTGQSMIIDGGWVAR